MITVTKYLENVLKAEGFGYWLGTYGQKATHKLWLERSRAYPMWYGSDDHKDDEMRWLNNQVVDCIGVDKFARWLQPSGAVIYDPHTDFNADGMFRHAQQLGMKYGPISTMPDVPGICLRKPGHFGVYIGNGISLESQGGNYGVVRHAVKSRPWTHWFYNPFVTYAVSEKSYKVICTELNIRSGPGTQFTKTDKTIGYGTVLIVDSVCGDWGHHTLGWSNIGPAYCVALSGVTATPPSTDYTMWPRLQKGAVGEYVKRMQVGLIKKGYNISAGATGHYLTQTETAALAFLKTVNLIPASTQKMDGITWGPRCWKALLG